MGFRSFPIPYEKVYQFSEFCQLGDCIDLDETRFHESSRQKDSVNSGRRGNSWILRKIYSNAPILENTTNEEVRETGAFCRGRAAIFSSLSM